MPFLPILFVAGNVIFLIYDYAFSKVMSLIQARLIPVSYTHLDVYKRQR